MHTHYAFENYRNTIRTLFIVITHCFIFGSMYVFYNKYSGNKEIIIPAVIFGTLSFFVHIGFLFYNLYMQKYHKEYRNTMEIVKDKKFKK
jgi:ascorbate-specific PTS system EIIC-type component UlaA